MKIRIADTALHRTSDHSMRHALCRFRRTAEGDVMNDLAALYAVSEGVATLIFNRPDRRKAPVPTMFNAAFARR